jgi:hypothetical protein
VGLLSSGEIGVAGKASGIVSLSKRERRMGTTYETITLKNAGDVIMKDRGLIKEPEVREITIQPVEVYWKNRSMTCQPWLMPGHHPPIKCLALRQKWCLAPE